MNNITVVYRRFVLLLGFLTGFSLAENPQGGGQIRIKLGTLAPNGSSWYLILQEMGQEWKEISNGRVTLTIYPDGVVGDEPAMVRKMLIGQLDATMMTTHGLGIIEPSVAAIQDIPLLYDSYEELDFVRSQLSTELSRRFENKGFVILNWGEAGWVRFFTQKPMVTPGELRKVKLFQWAGDPEVLTLWRTMGFKPVPLAATDIAMALQTGLITGIDTTPLAALSNQWFALANHMADIKWAPLIGGTIITHKTWNAIPENYRGRMLDSAHRVGKRFRTEIRKQDEQAIEVMKEHGLVVHHVDESEHEQWKKTVENAYPFIRGRIVPEDLFDEVLRLMEEFRDRNE